MSTDAPPDEILLQGALGGFPGPAVRRAAQHVLAEAGRTATLSITFLSATAMQRLNAEAFGRDRLTDVIAYALPQPDGSLLGDIYLSRAAAARAAHQFGHSTREEILRLVIHGVLHVLGEDHPEGEERLQSPMWERQEALLRALTC